MDKETLSNYGWIVICILVLSVMIALATPFGTYISNAVKSTTEGLFDVQQKAMGVAGLVVDDQQFDNYGNLGYQQNASELNPIGTIQKGAYCGYMNTETNEIVWYNEIPSPLSHNDFYIYGDYIYAYNEETNGWSVALATFELMELVFDIPDYKRITRNQTAYGEILESINGKPITDLSHTFRDCSSLINSPIVPKSVTNVLYSFEACVSLKNITFKGTIEQWRAMYNGTDWDIGSSAVKIICSDGTITL